MSNLCDIWKNLIMFANPTHNQIRKLERLKIIFGTGNLISMF